MPTLIDAAMAVLDSWYNGQVFCSARSNRSLSDLEAAVKEAIQKENNKKD